MRRAVSWAMAVVLICQPALAIEIDATAEELEACKTEGGCALVTMQWLKRFMSEAHDAGVAQCKADFRNRT